MRRDAVLRTSPHARGWSAPPCCGREGYSEFATAVLDGLLGRRKSLPCRYFYDARGSELFEQITALPEYYPTRTETAILAEHAAAIMRGAGADTVLVEFGAGSSRKTEHLLDAAPELGAYVPIDVSPTALETARRRLVARYPRLRVAPIVGDFTGLATLELHLPQTQRIGFFPGSTIGNFEPNAARDLLTGMRRWLAESPGESVRLIIGVDLVKDEATLIRAYDDAAGVTAAFNLNLLARINRTFGPAFDLTAFAHRAVWCPAPARIEMHLVSRRRQTVRLLGHDIAFASGEAIHTESSHKFTLDGFGDLARAAGWRTDTTWCDAERLFSVHALRPA